MRSRITRIHFMWIPLIMRQQSSQAIIGRKIDDQPITITCAAYNQEIMLKQF